MLATMRSSNQSHRSALSSMLWLCLILAFTWLIPTISAQDTCDIDGVEYLRGDMVDKESRCGRQMLYPCFCNPDLVGQEGLDCPYCSISALQDGEVNIRCFRDGQRLSFVDPNNQGTTCACDASTPGISNEICTPDPLASVCIEENPVTNEVITLQPGDQYQFLGDSRCGNTDDFPCFCAPTYPDKIACPYCAISLANGNLKCIRHLATERIIAADNPDTIQDCSCEVPDPFNDPLVSCTTAPTQAPAVVVAERCQITTSSGNVVEFQEGQSLGDSYDFGCGSSFPCFCNPNLASQIECPYCGFADPNGDARCTTDNEQFTYNAPDQNGGQQLVRCSCSVVGEGTSTLESLIDCDGGFVPPPIESCVSTLSDGETVVTAKGESYGDLIVGPCGVPTKFPTLCNKDAPNEQEYPYCQFSARSGALLCTKNDERVEFLDLLGNLQSCGCNYASFDSGPVSDCEIITGATDRPVAPPTEAPIRPTSAPVFPMDPNTNNSASYRIMEVGWHTVGALALSTALSALFSLDL